MINKLKSIYFYLLYKVNKLKSAKIVCLEMVRLLCSEIWVFAFVGWRYVPSPPVLSRVNNNVMLIICHTVQHKIDFYLWNFKSTIRRMCLFMFWCWACHKTESTDLPFEYEHVCHGVKQSLELNQLSKIGISSSLKQCKIFAYFLHNLQKRRLFKID